MLQTLSCHYSPHWTISSNLFRFTFWLFGWLSWISSMPRLMFEGQNSFQLKVWSGWLVLPIESLLYGARWIHAQESSGCSIQLHSYSHLEWSPKPCEIHRSSWLYLHCGSLPLPPGNGGALQSFYGQDPFMRSCPFLCLHEGEVVGMGCVKSWRQQKPWARVCNRRRTWFTAVW